MAYIDGTGRIILDDGNSEPIEGWALLIHGKTQTHLLFSSKDRAEACAIMERLTSSDIVPVTVTGEFVTRADDNEQSMPANMQ